MAAWGACASAAGEMCGVGRGGTDGQPSFCFVALKCPPATRSGAARFSPRSVRKHACRVAPPQQLLPRHMHKLRLKCHHQGSLAVCCGAAERVFWVNRVGVCFASIPAPPAQARLALPSSSSLIHLLSHGASSSSSVCCVLCDSACGPLRERSRLTTELCHTVRPRKCAPTQHPGAQLQPPVPSLELCRAAWSGRRQIVGRPSG